MNPGLSEEVGTTARVAIEAMKAQPLMLAVLVLNAMVMTFVFLGIRGTRDAEVETRKAMLAQIAHSTELLSGCIVPK